MSSGIIAGVKVQLSDVQFVVDAYYDANDRMNSLALISSKLKIYALLINQRLYFNGETFYIGKKIDENGCIYPSIVVNEWKPFIASGLPYAMYSVHNVVEM